MQTYPLRNVSLTLISLLALQCASAEMASPGPANHTCQTAQSAAASPSAKAIPWEQIGVKAAADYHGDGLAILPTAEGARLHCVFQRLDGEATPQGLWLTSTVSNGVGERFCVRAVAVGRRLEAGEFSRAGSPSRQPAPSGPSRRRSSEPGVSKFVSVFDSPTHWRAFHLSTATGQKEGVRGWLPVSGTVSIEDKLVRWARPGLLEEYSVSLDGVRQDFVVMERPAGEGELQVGLGVVGAGVEARPGGARLVLEQSGRKISYSRLRATDANGRELPARVEVLASNSESRSTEMAVVVNDAGAVYPVRIDPTFSDDNWVSMGGTPGANDGVWAVVVDGAGNLYIGGSFTVVGETIANGIAKWNGNGWSALGEGMSGGYWEYGGWVRWVPASVYALAMFGSDLYAGGCFTNAGGIAASSIAKWSGSTWSAVGEGMTGGHWEGGFRGGYWWVPASVYALAVWGSDLYAGGGFTNAGGIAATGVAKWDGTGWSALGSGVGDGYLECDEWGTCWWISPVVNALAVCGSNLYAGGDFTVTGGSPANCIAKWNRSEWSAVGSGTDDYGIVHALAVSDSDLYAGGWFTIPGGVAANIAKWDGRSWSALGEGIQGEVYALAVAGSSLYAGGDFNSAAGIAKWNGSAWSALGSGVNTSVSALAVLGSDLYAGGTFTTVGGRAANHIAKWDGSAWSPLGSGINSSVRALVVSGSDLYLGGDFITAGGIAANCIAKWNGSEWSALGEGIHGQVYALAVSGSPPNLYAGGYFNNAGGIPANGIAKWDGSAWSALGSGVEGTYAGVSALAVSGSNLYAGGPFTMAGSRPANHIAKWDGSAWSALGSGVAGTYAGVSALAVSAADLYAGGTFTNAGGIAATNIAKWNGSEWSPLGSGIGRLDPYASVYALAVSGSELYAGGWFTNAGGIGATNIAKWNGSGWWALGSGVSGAYAHVSALAVSGSELYAGGWFTSAGGTAATNIAKWNGSAWSALGSGMNGGVSTLAVFGSDLYAGGSFTTAGDKVSAYVAKAIAISGDWLRIQEGVPGPGTNTLNYTGVPNAQYLVQFATNPTTGPWLTLATNTVGANGRGTALDYTAANAQRFYRISAP